LWNQRHPLFRDPVVRRTLTLAINRRELNQVLNYPPDLPLFDVVFTGRQYWRGELPEPLPYDPELAKQLLEAAGWRDADGDGVRERAGVQARFTLITHGSSYGVWLGEEAALYVQDQLRRVGIRMDVQILASSLKHARVRAGEFDAAFYRVSRRSRRLLEDNWFGEGSRITYHNPELVRLLREAAEMGFDPEGVDRIYRELWEIFRADLPITFVHTQIITYVAHRRLRGLRNYRGHLLQQMADLWLEDEH
jgi:peptide/nickel transport system substrate-binding protein